MDGDLRSLWVGSLPLSVGESDLEAHFRSYGGAEGIRSVYVQRHPSRESRGFAFVNFYDKRSAEVACSRLHGTTLKGKQIKVNVKARGRSASREQILPIPLLVQPKAAAATREELIRPASSTKDTFSYDDKLALRLLIKRHWSTLVELGKSSHVYIHREADGCSLKLEGTSQAIDAIRPKIERQLQQKRQSLAEQMVHLDELESSSLVTADVSNATSKLQQEHCVTITWPGQKEGIIQKVDLPNGSIQLTRHPILAHSHIVDAIICPTTGDISHAKGLGKGIAKVEGESITSACQKHVATHGYLKPTEAKAFPVSNLKCRCVVFTALPDYSGAEDSEDEATLKDSVINSLCCAERNGAVSVAMPAFSGQFGFGADQCARVTLKAIQLYLANDSNALRDVIISLVDPGLIDAFQEAFSDIQHDAKETSTKEAVRTEWLFKNDRGAFQVYAEEANSFIAAEYQKNPKGCCVLDPSRSKQKDFYMINFQTMTQTNVTTKKERPVRRNKTSDATTQIQWFYEDGRGELVPYSDSVSRELESARKSGKRSVTVSSLSVICDLINMTEVNMSTMKKSKISREVVQKRRPAFSERLRGKAVGRRVVAVTVRGESADARAATAKFRKAVAGFIKTLSLAYPKHLQSQVEKVVEEAKGHFNLETVDKRTDGSKITQALKGVNCFVSEAVKLLQSEIVEIQNASIEQDFPPEWGDQRENLELRSLSTKDAEYQEIRKLVRRTLPSAVIKHVQRIQNKWLWRRFVHHRKEMEMKNDGVTNEMDLFHGTRETPPEKIFGSEEGFDMRYSNKGLWGQGNYFAVNASYSHSYSYSAGYRQFLLAKVLTGKSADIPKDGSLRMPPLLNSGAGSGLFEGNRYDTVTGETNGSRVFITYKNDKAYPLYLITYTV